MTVSPAVEVSIWPLKAERPSETVRLNGTMPLLSDPSVAVSLDGRYVAASASDRPLTVVWEKQNGGFKEAKTFKVAAARLAFSPDCKRLAAGHFICELSTGKHWELENPPGSLWAIAFSGDGRRFAGTSDYEAALWDVENGKQLARYKTNPVRYSRIALDQTGEVMVGASGWKPETVFFVDPKTGAPIPRLSGPDKIHCRWASFVLDAKTVLLGDQHGVTWWDPVAGKEIRRFEGTTHSWYSSWCLSARLSPDGKTLVGTSGLVLLRWDAATGKPLFPDIQDAGHHLNVTAIGVSPDGKWIATGGYDSRLRIWEAATGRSVAAVPASRMWSTHDFDFSPDGRFLFGPTAGDQGLTKWETATGREVLRFTFSPEAPCRGGVSAARLLPDGRHPGRRGRPPSWWRPGTARPLGYRIGKVARREAARLPRVHLWLCPVLAGRPVAFDLLRPVPNRTRPNQEHPPA